jgi:hypothetical protein
MAEKGKCTQCPKGPCTIDVQYRIRTINGFLEVENLAIPGVLINGEEYQRYESDEDKAFKLVDLISREL